MPKTKDAVTSMTVLLFMIYIVIQIQHKFAVTALFLFLYCINSVGPIQFLYYIMNILYFYIFRNIWENTQGKRKSWYPVEMVVEDLEDWVEVPVPK